jgi:hypothetical protein
MSLTKIFFKYFPLRPGFSMYTYREKSNIVIEENWKFNTFGFCDLERSIISDEYNDIFITIKHKHFLYEKQKKQPNISHSEEIYPVYRSSIQNWFQI